MHLRTEIIKRKSSSHNKKLPGSHDHRARRASREGNNYADPQAGSQKTDPTLNQLQQWFAAVTQTYFADKRNILGQMFLKNG